jgi:hypothetical protein
MIVNSDEAAARELAAMLKSGDRDRTYVTRRYATVVSVAYPKCSIRYDGETAADDAHDGVSMTVSCKGMAKGDRVMVDIVGHLATVTGVIAK